MYMHEQKEIVNSLRNGLAITDEATVAPDIQSHARFTPTRFHYIVSAPIFTCTIML